MEVMSERFSGPLPPPGFLREYESACPGSAERIIRLTEAEAEHRRAMELAVVQAEIDDRKRESNEARRGQFCALAIVVVSLAAGVYTAMNGHEWTGSILGVGGIGGIVTTFVLGRKTHRNHKLDIPPEKQDIRQQKKNWAAR